MLSIHCTEVCVFIKSLYKIADFYFQLQESIDQEKEPSENLGPQIQEQMCPGHEDQVVIAHDQVLVLRTRSWSGPPNTPYIVSTGVRKKTATNK